MSKDWIIEVLDDLRAFASSNGLPLLAEQLEEVRIVAAVEIAQDRPAVETETDAATFGRPALEAARRT